MWCCQKVRCGLTYFDQTLCEHAPESWAAVCWPHCIWLNDLSRTDWDHLRMSHLVSSDVKTACLAQYFLPWTVGREIWTDALKPCNSGISTDVLLFSELGHALHHHYRVFQGASPMYPYAGLSDSVAGVCFSGFCYGPLWAAQRYGTFLSGSGQSPRKSHHTSCRLRPTRVQETPEVQIGVPDPV